MVTRKQATTLHDGKDRHQPGKASRKHEHAHARMTTGVLVPGGGPLLRHPEERHRAAVANTLSWADNAAAQGDYAEALAWLEALDAMGEPLGAEYRSKRAAWQEALTRGRAAA